MEVLKLVVPFAAGLRRDRGRHVAHHTFRKFALVEGRICGRAAVLRHVCRQPRARQDRCQVELALPGRRPREHLQILRTPDDVREPADAEGGKDLAHLLRNKAEIVDHHLRQAGEVLRAQHVVLGRHSGRAVVEMADAQVLASERHHGRGAEAEALGADDGGLHHIEPGLQSSVGLQPHAMTQLVEAQRLMCLGEAELPGRARVLDRGERACAGAAVVAGDGDEVRVSLGHSGRHRADTGLGHQLHRHQRLGIHLLQVEDQLREILDGVDVVVRRR